MSQKIDLNRLLKNSRVLTISRVVFRILLPFYGGLKVGGHENIPASGQVLICPNHTTDLDPVVILAATNRPDLNALGKSELFEIPVLGAYFHAMGAAPVIRDSPDRAALRTAEAILGAGRMLLIFPEGRCSQNGLLQELQPGAVMLSLRTGAPIIPTGIRGARNILPYGDYIPRFAGGGVRVTFGRALLPSNYRGLSRKEAQSSMMDDLRRALNDLTGQC